MQKQMLFYENFPCGALGQQVRQTRDFPGDPVAKTLCSQYKGPEFDSWLRNQIPHATTRDLHTEMKIEDPMCRKFTCCGQIINIYILKSIAWSLFSQFLFSMWSIALRVDSLAKSCSVICQNFSNVPCHHSLPSFSPSVILESSRFFHPTRFS